MHLSARNQLPGTVTAVTRGVTTAQVAIDIGHGIVVTATVTSAAVADLRLKPGVRGVAVIKASDVIIGVP